MQKTVFEMYAHDPVPEE